ncbi:MAG: PilZ domain-containing protein [Myxococcales bacterium]|nr:PilZ domain-containing protein [Myxococcales bacterium]
MGDEDNRRAADRHTVYMGAEITTPEGKVRSAITQDASATGLLLLTRAKIEIGAKISIRVYVPGEDDKSEVVEGTVVRKHALDASESSLWREKVAVHFDTNLPEWLTGAFVSVSEKQEQLFGKKK